METEISEELSGESAGTPTYESLERLSPPTKINRVPLGQSQLPSFRNFQVLTKAWFGFKTVPSSMVTSQTKRARSLLATGVALALEEPDDWEVVFSNDCRPNFLPSADAHGLLLQLDLL